MREEERVTVDEDSSVVDNSEHVRPCTNSWIVQQSAHGETETELELHQVL
jgi:hypothetical protein